MLSLHPAEQRRLLVVLGGAAMLLVVAMVYASSLRGPFLWDDHVLVEQEDVSFRSGPLGALFTQPFWPDTSATDGHVPYYRPLTLLSYRFDIALGGTPEQFHFTNVGLHLIAAALLAVTATRFGASGRASVVGALAWALAPRLTESVAWISGRTDVLAAVFGFAALALTPATRSDAPLRRSSGWRLVLSGAFLLGALLSKESGLAFAVALFVTAALGKRSRSSKLVLLASTAIPVALYFALRWFALRHHGASRSVELTPRTRALTVLEAIGRYAEMSVDALRPRTSIGLIGEPDVGRAVIGFAVLVTIGAALVVLRRHVRDGVIVAAALVGTGFALVVHLAPLNLSGAVTADRLLYVPLAGLTLALTVSAHRLSARAATAAGAVAVALCLVLAGATKVRLEDYRNEARFWLAAAEHAHPHNVSPRNGLAGVVVRTDDVAVSCRLYEASRASLVSSGRATSAAHRRTRENLAACWAREGKYPSALHLSEELANEFPAIGRIRLALGYARLHLLDFDGAEKAWLEARAIDPGLKRVVRGELADLVSARTDATRFASGPATSADAWRYANFLAHVGRLAEADQEFSRVAHDASSSVVARRDATRFLVRYGKIAAARGALDQWKALADEDVELIVLRSVLRARTLDQASVTALRPRIEALAENSR